MPNASLSQSFIVYQRLPEATNFALFQHRVILSSFGMFELNA